MKKKIAILGSTGSIGVQTLDVVAQHPDCFEVELLTANNNIELLAAQARRFKPLTVVTANPDRYGALCQLLAGEDISVLAGPQALDAAVRSSDAVLVVAALVGYAGLSPTLAAIESGKDIALANKETLVVAGETVMQTAMRCGVKIYPVDSEHSAIFQCLAGENVDEIEQVLLTASGGPFRGFSADRLATVTPADALKHPNWNMGAKVTIDSASLMNKGFEVIEAKWLFGLHPRQIEVLVHPQSIIHSMVQFRDGSIKAQMGAPDMRLPIQYALHYPSRLPSCFPRTDFAKYSSLTFEKPDIRLFRNLSLAFEAMNCGGNMPCILNAANEVAVSAFLKGQLGFVNMPDLIEATMQKASFVAAPALADYVCSDAEARRIATDMLR
ncbi:MAG: 1-deoxy-D-xylulose-5-phosphate reductoisomerase [Bacteroidales bacterium]|jgi:1-deoxy-D-xylulose-5-phosphate reductoisomerase|nr:1-deoxy-D-xylulose-5-phosphate reductoisomerase [Bacteroidales bacterium]